MSKTKKTPTSKLRKAERIEDRFFTKVLNGFKILLKSVSK